jgi:leader peptidase (prepilin peptidase)/N-methyltransferase
MSLDLLAQATALVLGLAVGSFLNVAADRLPRGLSVVTPRSHCDGCGRPLAGWEMIPILSYVLLRGRCRTCGVSIGLRVVVMEVMGAAIALLAWRLYGPTPGAALAAIFGWLLLTLSVIDVEHHVVPRLFVLCGVFLAIVAAPWWLPAGQRSALLGGLVAGLPYALLYLAAGVVYGRGKGIGLGDVWVAALMGMITGYPAVIVALLTAAIVALAVAVALLATGARGRRDAVPTVPFLALGALGGVLWNTGYLMVAARLLGQ